MILSCRTTGPSGHRNGFQIKFGNKLLKRILPQLRIIVEFGNTGFEKGSSLPERSRQHLSTKTRRRFENRRANKRCGKIV